MNKIFEYCQMLENGIAKIRESELAIQIKTLQTMEALTRKLRQDLEKELADGNDMH
jgi:hypothetical protein